MPTSKQYHCLPVCLHYGRLINEEEEDKNDFVDEEDVVEVVGLVAKREFLRWIMGGVGGFDGSLQRLLFP